MSLVLNDTKVIPAELHGERLRDGNVARISATLIERLDASRWLALARPGKRLAPGDRIRFGAVNDNACLVAGLDARSKGKARTAR